MRRDEDGSISVFMAVAALALLVVAGMVTDGGNALAAKSRDGQDAFAAARAGANALPVGSIHGGQALSLNPYAATQAAQAALAADGHHGSVVVSGVTVRVTVTSDEPTVLLGLVGIGHMVVSASSAASAVAGP